MPCQKIEFAYGTLECCLLVEPMMPNESDNFKVVIGFHPKFPRDNVIQMFTMNFFTVIFISYFEGGF